MIGISPNYQKGINSRNVQEGINSSVGIFGRGVTDNGNIKSQMATLQDRIKSSKEKFKQFTHSNGRFAQRVNSRVKSRSSKNKEAKTNLLSGNESKGQRDLSSNNGQKLESKPENGSLERKSKFQRSSEELIKVLERQKNRLEGKRDKSQKSKRRLRGHSQILTEGNELPDLEDSKLATDYKERQSWVSNQSREYISRKNTQIDELNLQKIEELEIKNNSLSHENNILK